MQKSAAALKLDMHAMSQTKDLSVIAPSSLPDTCYIYMWQANSTWACMYVCLTMSEQKKGLFVDYSEWSMYSVCTLIICRPGQQFVI